MGSSKRFRELLDGPEIFVIPAVFDALSARLVSQTGFRAASVGGSTVTNTMLGLPDGGYLTLTEMAWVVSRITAVCDMPVFVDIDNGYGNAINVVRTIRTIEAAGAAGVMMEDQDMPKRSGGMGKAIVPVPEMVSKIKAAVDSRRDPDFVIIGRTDAHAVDGLDAAIERGNLYVEAGADVMFADGAIPRDQLARIGREVDSRKLVNISPGTKARPAPAVSLAELQEMGFDAALVGVHVVRAAALGMYEFLSNLSERGLEAGRDLVRRIEGTPFENWYDFTGFGDLRAQEERYLAPEQTALRYGRTPDGYHVPQAAAPGDAS